MDTQGGLPQIHQTPPQQTGRTDRKETYIELLAPGPVHHPGSHVRNPILGTMASYSTYMPAPPGSSGKRHHRKPISSLHKSTHEKSIFDHTGYQESFFIIHPQWTSEGAGIRRMRTVERRHYNWANRPSHTGPPAEPLPLVDYILPLLHKKKEKDSLLRNTLQSAQEHSKPKELSDRERLVRATVGGGLERNPAWGVALPTLSNGTQGYKVAQDPNNRILY